MNSSYWKFEKNHNCCRCHWYQQDPSAESLQCRNTLHCKDFILTFSPHCPQACLRSGLVQDTSKGTRRRAACLSQVCCWDCGSMGSSSLEHSSEEDDHRSTSNASSSIDINSWINCNKNCKKDNLSLSGLLWLHSIWAFLAEAKIKWEMMRCVEMMRNDAERSSKR